MTDMVFLTGCRLEEVWMLLKRVSGSTTDECPTSGECWQYMGSHWESAGVLVSEFRHRNLNRPHWIAPRRCLIKIRQFLCALPAGAWNAEVVTHCYVTGDTDCAKTEV